MGVPITPSSFGPDNDAVRINMDTLRRHVTAALLEGRVA